jgi:hypothetical protein
MDKVADELHARSSIDDDQVAFRRLQEIACQIPAEGVAHLFEVWQLQYFASKQAELDAAREKIIEDQRGTAQSVRRGNERSFVHAARCSPTRSHLA